jgi:hypothetical protein
MRTGFAVAACILTLAAPASSQDVTGTWDATFNTPNGSRPATLILKKDGEELGGTISGGQGETPIQGTQKGTALSLSFTVQTQNGPMLITMSGTQTGDELTGSADYGGNGQGEWAAKRAATSAPAKPAGQAKPSEEAKSPVDVSGPWALQVDTGSFTATPTVTFKQEGEKLTGQYVGQLGESSVTGTIKDREITWSVDLTFEGNKIRLVYTGTVDKDAMKGTVTLGDMGEGTFTGKRK